MFPNPKDSTHTKSLEQLFLHLHFFEFIDTDFHVPALEMVEFAITLLAAIAVRG
jgi:hypothetical protein